ncbi:MAG: type II secretion system F family protein [Chelatococcus sp.]|jgi:tight adherence protein C|nr:type II secretion system F family protein [Chelatococcus sp. HY11]MBX3536855.1 type II secretion system F family protein [Chelatococcus sp.]MBX3546179.1 type II secretion system F family protein [Chelatococcus sp.]CAH1662062.1 Type II/IV secretion system protein TadC, associated with Flp pilus assembly [Hyphomicrobiales bacterium]CAH1682856.1 Type II/IV secretion system protein TadC, associated with Flp pilus assembly [Hyphomicrobiales bacterium]
MSAFLSMIADRQFMFSILIALCVGATVLTLAMPLMAADTLGKRMKSVASERERIRQRERERLGAAQAQRASLRPAPKAYMKQVVDRLNLSQWLGTETAKMKLSMAGYRGNSAEINFLFFRLISPIGFCIVAITYMFVLKVGQFPGMVRFGIVIAATYAGIKLPELFLANRTQKRQQSIKRAWPDALDLLLICVESSMSVEQAFRKVSQEIGAQSIALAEELMLTTAELSYLAERRQAYENLGIRTGVESVKNVTTALIQAERYGTPVGQALRVLAQESRDARMNEAEKKAAALPPKLTVPMILFFLPVLFMVIITPALIQVFKWK